MTQNTGLNWQRDDFTDITNSFENDLLNRAPLAEHLTRYIDRLQVGAVLALDARWGEGKTWFVRLWKAYLEQTEIPHNVIYLNAFAQDYVDDPFMVLSAEITHAFDNANPDDALIKTFKESATSVAKALLPELPKLLLSLGMTLMGAGYLGKTLESIGSTVKGTIDSTKEFYGEEVFDGISEAIDTNISDAIQQRFEKHEADKQTLQAFKQSLYALANNQDLNPQPLVFIIDELDRCNPLFSVRLIERIKHFFDIPNIVFVLVCDKHQLQKTICHQFGYDNEYSEAYLDKFVDFTIKLERPTNVDRKNEYLEIIATYLNNLGFTEDEVNKYKHLALICATVHNKSIRQIKKILNSFSLLHINQLSDNNCFLLYKLFNPLIDNQTPIFMHMFYEFIRYFDKSLKYEDGNVIEEYVKTSLFTREAYGYVLSEKVISIQASINQSMSREIYNLFETICLLNRQYIRASIDGISWSEINYNSICIKPARTPFEINDDWNEYIKTGLNE